MTDKPETDAEAIVALDGELEAFCRASYKNWDNPKTSAIWRVHRRNEHRPSLDAAAAYRRAQSASGLAGDVRKIVEALEPFATFGICDDGKNIRDGLMRDRIVDWFGPADFDAARAALAPLPEMTPEPTEDDDLQARELD